MPIYDDEIANLTGQENPQAHPSLSGQKPRHSRAVVVLVLVLILGLWLTFDQVTKAYFDAQPAGVILGGPYAGLVQFTLVHNTGMAWGLFGDSTLILGILSLIVCAAFFIYGIVAAPKLNWAEVIGLGLVVAGGVGNALDRFTLGYVVDFIQTAFMNFPVFNIADIGVTCGFVLFIIGLFAHTLKEPAASPAAADTSAGE